MTRMPRGAERLKWRRQRQAKARRWPSLNLVALMDVFTILVFFFLVYSTDGTQQPGQDRVQLPESLARQAPRDTPLVLVTRDHILLQGEPVIDLARAMAGDEEIQALAAALQAQAAGDGRAGAERELTIMGDRTIPFAVLNRVMRTCQRAGYGAISLSVLQRSPGSG